MKNKFKILLVIFASLSLAFYSCDNSSSKSTNQPLDAQDVAVNEGGELYQLDGEKSVIFWKGTKPIGDGHNGRVPVTLAEIQIDDNKVLSGYFEFDLNNIICDDLEGETADMLVNHLKSEDFFDVEKFPKGEFTITNTEFLNESSDACLISGNLKIKDIEKNITFKANVTKGEGTFVAITEDFTIDRTLWGVNYKSKNIFKNLKDEFINDDINLRIEIYVKS